MITTNDVKTKVGKPEKLKIIRSDKVAVKEFDINGKPAEPDKTIITTANVEKLQKKARRTTKK